ncbi:WD40 repeat protein [Neolewinella xylanilytica]|uniref:WD40 repeat protein n=1 Tax=Neolewinella xylanilytica TaxID=1514080 RepID=A0A2S6IAV3_9BACT|nr:PD40 domain-containing protein [Neolewinella xylanilytica]PPK88634.1 WD40 repeat protein [Neolewinella xylanilytica]
MKPIYRILLLALLAVPFSSFGQGFNSFGQNKPNYENFDYDVYQSPHFEMYTYIDNEEWLKNFLNDSEEWYRVHQLVLNDTIDFKNPMIIYANHADFQQTNAISGQIGSGTGGVTEAFKNRVVLPVAHTNAQTHHVLGHELVHAFQYDMVIRGDSTNLRNLSNLPLWMVEGLAEYLSIGSVDPFTAMWMRDAVLNDDVPSLKDLSSGRYFPYRYGQAFWSFVTGLKGDDIINPYFRATAKWGLEPATKMVLGYDFEDFSKLWEDALRKTYGDQIGEAKEDRFVGDLLVGGEKNGGRINIAPEISPNGKYMIYLSEQDLFSIDMFLADAKTGEQIRKIRTRTVGTHIDEISYIETSGTWSPDSKQFAYTAVSKGQNVLIIADVESGKSEREIRPKDLPAFTFPSWSPDGRSIVVAGLKQGQTDLYSIDVRSGRVTQLTNDIYSEIHPSWSADGTTIYYSTDARGMQLKERPHGALRFNLAALNVASRESREIDVFPGADNLNPIEGQDGKLYFLSNRDGFRNIYRFDPATGVAERMTDLITGVSGITHYAPAMSMDRSNNRLVYTYFNQKGYKLFGTQVEAMTAVEVPADSVDLSPATLPRLNPRATLQVDELLANMDKYDMITSDEIISQPYRPQFKLDYASGGAGAGVGTNQVFGTTTGLAGGVQLLFSDILGNNQLMTSLSLNGEITDFGGSVAWLNKKTRVNYGFSLSRIPFRNFATIQPFLDTLQYADDQQIELINAPYIISRLYQNQVGGFASYAFNTNLRLEGSLSGAIYNNRVDEYARYFNPNTGYPIQVNAQPERREDLEQESFNLYNGGVALVGDNASFGLTAPIKGHRFRIGVDQYAGRYDFTAVNTDYRQYLWFGKGALAFRALHFGRYGEGGQDLYPLYVGSPWYMRGLNANDAINTLENNGRNINELLGSKVLVSNLELRIPFTGPKQIALIKSGILFSDLNLFVDAGMAFTDFAQFSGPEYTLDKNGEILTGPDGEPYLVRPGVQPIFTAGVSTRVNVFGQIVVEPYLARPLIDGGRWSFGVNLLPGW